MKGDFARVTFDRTLHFSRVLQQQGRVLLEADWNEQGAIGLHLLRTLITDLVGACWAAGDGFTIGFDGADSPAEWTLSPGHFYVDGILCENEVEGCTLGHQPHSPIPDDDGGDGAFSAFAAPAALWLDVWERHLSWVEAPGLLDPALNGVDTCSRAEVVWQVRPLDVTARRNEIVGVLEARAKATNEKKDNERIALEIKTVKDWSDAFDPRGTSDPKTRCAAARGLLAARKYVWPMLRAQVGSGKHDDSACVISADARYRGVENQLYRVEIHDGGPEAPDATSDVGATFKWSRENGSVIFPIVRPSDATESTDDTHLVVLATLGRDQRLGLQIGDWVEVIDDETTLTQRVRPLLLVKDVRPDERSVLLQGAMPSLGGHPLLRRWDQRRDVNKSGVVRVTVGDPIELEDNVTVTFEPGGLYEPGDYWLIPARVATGGLDWPEDSDESTSTEHVGVARPASSAHHAAVLGILVDGTPPFEECHCRQPPLCNTDTGTDAFVAPSPAKLERTKTPVRDSRRRRRPPG